MGMELLHQSGHAWMLNTAAAQRADRKWSGLVFSDYVLAATLGVEDDT
jgi:hypothetical protein